MNKSLVIIPVILTCLSSLAFAGNAQKKGEPSPKSEHEITVGNPQAAESGSVADDKTVKEEKTLPGNNKDHDITVGNPQAAESGSVADDKTVKEEKTLPGNNKDHDKDVGKAKAKGHDKK